MRSSTDVSGKASTLSAWPGGIAPTLAILGAGFLSGATVFLAATALDSNRFSVLLLLAGISAGAIAWFIQRRDRRQLHAVVEQVSDAVAVLKLHSDGTFDVMYANRQARRLCDLATGSAASFPLLQIPPLLEKLRLAAAGQQGQQEEISLPADGEQPRCLYCQIMPVPCGAAVVIRDISAHKAEEKETRENRAFLQSLIEYLPVLIFAKSFRQDNYDKMVVWNKTAEHVMGYSTEQVVGKSNDEIFPSKVADTLNALDRQMLAAPKVVTIPEFPYRRPDGALCYLRSTSVPLFGEEGRVDYILGMVEDITARRAQEWDLRTQRAELAAINDALPVGLFRTDAEGRVLYVNVAFERMMGLQFEQIARVGWHAALHPDDRDTVLAEWARAMHNDRPYENTLRFMVGKNRILWASVKSAQIRMDGKVRGYVGSVDDITLRLQAEQDVLKGERWLRTIADNLPALIAYIDKDQHYRFTNINYEKLFHREDAQVLGSHVSEVFGAEYYAFTSNRITAALRGERVSFERESKDRAGRLRCWRVEYIPDVQDGKVAGFYSMVLDITEAKELENRLRTLARIDSLTGLANRSWFNEKLTQAITDCDARGLHLGILFLDIDQFKTFNDTFGHHGGDLVLREFSRRLTACVRHTDTVARLAGDEFVILLIGNDIGLETEIVAKKIIAEMRRDIALPSGPCQVTTSIGITVRRHGENDTEMLLRRADEALYAAKSQGRNSYRSVL